MDNEDTKVKDDEGTGKEEPKKLSPEEERAIELGWKPKDQWTGPEDDFVPAKQWLKYGDLEHEFISAQQANKHKDKVINAMKNHYVNIKEDVHREIEGIIRAQKKEALKQEDFQAVAELDQQLDVLKQNLNQTFERSDKKVSADDVSNTEPPPEFSSWNRLNPWYKLGSQDEMTKEADTMAIGWQARNPNAPYQECLKYVEDRIKKLYPEKFKREHDVVTPVDDGGSERTSSTLFKKGSTYKLDDAQKAAARAFGMTEEEYAKDLKRWDKQRGIL